MDIIALSKLCHSMEVNEVVEAVERFLLPRRLSSIEKFIIYQSWLGETYSKMAQKCGYASDYIKEVGSHLWQEVSEALGERVTKKNLHLVLNNHKLEPTNQPKQKQTLNSSTDTNPKKDNLPNVSIDTAIKFPGGPIPLNSPLYINRPPVEELAYKEISQPGSVTRIRASKKMGKSSLLHRIITRAKTLDYKTVYIDFQEADETIFTCLDRFLRWLCANVSRQLNLSSRLDDYWDEDMGSKVSCKIYFEAYLLAQIDRPVVLAFNEVNLVFEHPNIAKDFLPMLRFWHELGKQDKLWQQLRLVVVHSTEIYIPLNINQSPFNVGQLITLPPFTPEQVYDLAQRYGLGWASTEEAQTLAPLIKMLSGHPYLLNLAFYYLRRREITLENLLQTASTSSGIFNDHLLSHLALLKESPELTTALQQVVNADNSVQIEAIAAHKLESMGLIELEGNWAKPSCELYRLYFREQLREENSHDVTEPEALEAQPQKLSYINQIENQIDELTQLATRQYFNEYIENNWQQWAVETSPLSLIICEVDYFKFFNDAHGSKVGDDCLQIIADTIHDCVEEYPYNFVARYEGAKFAVILPQLDTEFAASIAGNIRDSVIALAIEHSNEHSKSLVGGFPSRVLTVSVGVASIIPNQTTSPEMLIAATEAAMHQAVRKGRNCVVVSPTLNVGWTLN